MRFARSAVIFALGFFALIAQTLLFRDFLTAFEGNELGIGSFFGSWLLWVALGALLGRIESRLHTRLSSRFELLVLLYIPAFLLQHHLIANARVMAGVQYYEVFSSARMFGVSLLANAPISLLTGFLFTLACRWSSRDSPLAPARVYILEALGSGAGGIAVTLLLAGGAAPEEIFVCASLVVATTVGILLILRARQERRCRRAVWALVPLAIVAGALLILAGGWWAEHNNHAAWCRLLPGDAYRGSFSTAQAEYLYGEREGQFVVMSWGGVSEALPSTEHASEVVALVAAQNPGARDILVVGPGSLSVCIRFLELPQVEHVTWLHPDPDYPNALLGRLPERFRRAAAKVDVPGCDVREHLRRAGRRYDLAVLNLPDATTLVLNRYLTQEFFSLLKSTLAEEGVVALRISGGANYMGGEFVYLGSSALRTLESVFERVVLKPGDESWLIASDAAALSESPAVLRDRFAGIEDARSVYPPEGLLSLYLPDRIEFQMRMYRRTAVEIEENVLLNTDKSPKALLYSLLLALRRAGRRSFTKQLPVLLTGGAWIFACAVLLYGLLRLVYLLKGPRSRAKDAPPGPPRLFDGYFLILSTGLSGMALGIALMFAYQSRFGSLFLYVGLISSLFMLGSFAGGLFTARVLTKSEKEPRYLLPVCIAAHLVLILLILLVAEAVPGICYFLLFALCGALTGVYFPIAAHRMRAAGRSAGESGSVLEMLDHIGGAAGGVLTGVFMLPVFGGQATLLIIALLLSVNLVPLLVQARTAPRLGAADVFDRFVRVASYAVFGVGAFLLIASQITATVSTREESQLLLSAAKTMTSRADLREEQARHPDGSVLRYYSVPDSPESPGGYVFGTAQLAGRIYGYGGTITLAVHTDRKGILREFRIIRSNETPSYLELLRSWEKKLAGRNMFERGSLRDVDAVTGATLTSDAILKILEEGGCAFASRILKVDVAGPPIARSRWLPDRSFLLLAALMLAAVVLRHVPGAWRRRIFLAATVLVPGLFLNMQYSTHQVFSLLGLNLPGIGLNGSFFLAVAIPAVVLLFGNVYCGYACPFGALQELLGDLRPKRLATDPRRQVWRYGRLVKYALLFLLVVLFAVTRDRAVLGADPLATFFSLVGGWAVTAMAIAALLLSVVFRRFWCRNLCPAGAFLSLLNGVRLLKRLTPPTRPGRCDLGVRSVSDLDCIFCDRCRHEKG